MESLKEEEEEEEVDEGEEEVVKMEVKEELKVEEVDVEVKLHSCDTCDFTSSLRLLRRHRRREHRGLLLPCTLCAFTTPWKVGLTS